MSAIKIVVSKTPFALLSSLLFVKTKKINKLGIAAKDNTLPYKPPAFIISNVLLKLSLEKYSKYKKTPAAVANSETKTPIRMCFFTAPKNLIFESCDVQSYQTEQVQ